MSPDRQRLAEEIFLAAVAAAPHERSSVIAARCQGDAELLAEVRSLLGGHDAAPPGFLNGPHPDVAAAVSHAGEYAAHVPSLDNTLPIGTRIAGYTLSRVLGAGGMGIVYVAEQERPRRTVALKLIRRGLGTSGLLRRFEHEAEILGRLQHPGIAQIFEAGVAQLAGAPQPFIAMELINGRLLTEHCDLYKLGTRDRLLLITKVADAIHHAHQRGVIHRDLKPANILVDDAGEPKILDFGVARISGHQFTALGLTSQHTGIGQVIGTLPFMSPEQVGGDPGDIDMRSDVYSIGVITYLLLTGRLPHDLGSRSIPDAARIIREEEPARLSTINRTLRGDVDTIVAMSIAKDRTRRYQSAKDLADDIRRYLSGEPVQARRDSALYILRKQMRRYRTLVSAGSIALVSLVVFLAYSIVQVREKSQLVAVADQRAEDLRRTLYASNIAFAQAAYLGNNVGRMRRVLDECPPELRGWEWRYLHHLSDSAAYSFRAFDRAWASVTLCPTSGIMVSAPVIGPARFWPLPAQRGGGEPITIQTTPQVAALELDNSGGRVLLTDAAGQTRLVALPSLKDLWEKSGLAGQTARSIFSPDDSTILLAQNDTIRTVDAATGVITRTFKVPLKTVVAARFNHRGDRVAVASRDGGVIIIDPAAVEPAPLALLGHSDGVFGLAFAPDDRIIATASIDQTVRLFDAVTGQNLQVIRSHANKVFCADFSPDGRLLATGGTEGIVQIHDPTTGTLMQQLHGHPERIIALRFYQDGRLMSCGVEGVVRVWDDVGRPDVPSINVPGPNVLWASAGREGQLVATCDTQGRVRLIEIPSGVVRDEWTVKADPANFGVQLDEPRRRAFALLGETVEVLESGKRETRSLSIPGARIIRAAISPDAAHLATTGRDAIVRILDIDSGRIVKEFPAPTTSEPCEQYGIVWSPDGSEIIACGQGGLAVYPAQGSPPPRRIAVPGSQFYSLVMLPDGHSVMACDEDSSVQIIDSSPAAPRPNRRLLGHGGGVYALALSPDGSRAISGGFDNSARLWDLASGLEMLTLRAHTSTVCALGFSADGRRIITVGQDRKIRLWETPLGEQSGPGVRAEPGARR